MGPRPTGSRLSTLVAALAGFVVGALPAIAQQDAPLSAIDWLSRSVEAPLFDPSASNLTARGVVLPPVVITSLDRTTIDHIGILSSQTTGLPATLWSASDVTVLVDLIRSERIETVPAVEDLVVTLMLAEADPAIGSGPDGALFLARVDKLLDLGALEAAQALLETAGPDTPELFRRWFDTALLTGTEDAACQTLRRKPEVEPTLPARIFCLARNGDWAAAALTLNTASALGDITPEDEALLARFLDPDLFEGEPLPPLPEPISPLIFRMREAIGESLPTAPLPRSFAHADLRSNISWRSQIEAAERLARHSAVSENILLSRYTAHAPAASGGVWDRVAAIQDFDRALRARDVAEISRSLPVAWRAMRSVRAEVPFARLYGPLLQGNALTGEAARLAYLVGLLSGQYETVANAATPETATDRLLQAVARGDVTAIVPEGMNEVAVVGAFSGTTQPPAEMAALLSQGRLGEAILGAVVLFQSGVNGDPQMVGAALATLRAVGLEGVARRAALEYLILERHS